MAKTLSNCNLSSLAPQETSSKIPMMNMMAVAAFNKLIHVSTKLVTDVMYLYIITDWRVRK